MAKRRGNPNWGKPEPFVVSASSETSFDAIVKSLGLSPHEYTGSAKLKDWVQKNKDQKYVPQDLLEAWGFKAASEI